MSPSTPSHGSDLESRMEFFFGPRWKCFVFGAHSWRPKARKAKTKSCARCGKRKREDR